MPFFDNCNGSWNASATIVFNTAQMVVDGLPGRPLGYWALQDLRTCEDDALKFIGCDKWYEKSAAAVNDNYFGSIVVIDGGLSKDEWLALERSADVDIIRHVHPATVRFYGITILTTRKLAAMGMIRFPTKILVPLLEHMG